MKKFIPHLFFGDNELPCRYCKRKIDMKLIETEKCSQMITKENETT